MATRKSEAEAVEFTLELPEDAESLLFSVTGVPVPPCNGERTVLWVRAREPGGDWGQSAWVEVACGDELAEHYTYRSKPVIPSALWMVPSRTYTIEVIPEGLLTPYIKVSCVRREPPPAPAPARSRGSVVDSPVLWAAYFLVLLLWMLSMVYRMQR